MNRFLGKYSLYVYTILRIVAGLMFAMHGSQKLLGLPGKHPPMPLASLMGVAGVIEFFGGLMIAIGLLTSYAAFIASGEMAVAYFMAHFPRHPLPIINQGELAVLFCFVFLYIAAQGSGVWSVDALIGKRRANPHTRRVITVRTCILIVVVLTLASITLAQSSQTKKRNGFSLFNGKDLTGWHLRNPAGLCAVSKAERIGCLGWRSLSALVEVLRCSALCTRTIRVVACDSRGSIWG